MVERESDKKIKMPQHIDITVNSKHTRKSGRKKLEDKPLTEEMMNFAWLIGSGMDEKIAGRKLGFSDHKIRAYIELEALQDQIEKTRALRTKKELKQWKELDEDWRVLVITKAHKIVEESGDKLPIDQMNYVKFLIGEWDKKVKAEGLNGPQGTNQRNTVTATQRITERKSEKQLTYTPKDEEVDFDDDPVIEDDEDEFITPEEDNDDE